MSSAGRKTLGRLVDHARRARSQAYAPYSGYTVGAAVLTSDGRVFSGCNVENAVYGATVCAERVAVWKAISAGAREIEALAVVTPSGGAPCGTCRQVLSEFAAPGTPVAVATPDGEHEALTLGDLLPRAWGASDLAAADKSA